MKKLLTLCLILSMSLFAWGCSSGNNAAQGDKSVIDGGAGENATALDYWTFVELHGQHFEKMLSKWNAEFPDRQIKLNVTVMPYDDMHNKLLIALQTGTGAPDISDIELGKFPDFLNGTPNLVELNDVIDPYRDTIVESRINIYSKDGKNYGIPTHVGATVAFYNTEMLEEAGIDYKDIVTFEDYKKAGIALYEKTGKYLGTADTSANWQAGILLAQQGSDLTDDYGVPQVNSPELIRGIEMMQDLLENNVISTIAGGQPDTEEAYGEYNAGNFASAFMPLWMMSRFTNYMPDLAGKIAIAPLPVLEQGMPRSVGGGGTGTVVTKTAKDVELAKEFLTYAKLSLDANIEIWNTLGFDPVNMDVWDMKDITHNPENMFVKYFVNSPFDVLNTIRDEIRMIKSTSASPTINNMFGTTTLNEIFEDGRDVTEALNEAQELITQQLSN
ncbi:MAG TPA: extracellular solute-binding protein [Candidatus Paenibacillus intestinavium]|nr:extracellular solute-binding protein [Candidatus Paenibacillus intestinavium]